jgi:hypothetical protein
MTDPSGKEQPSASAAQAPPKRATPRVREHVERLRVAGFDTQKFFDALVALRDDTALPRAHRDALYKLIAMESFVWYLEAIRNEPVDRVKLLEEAAKALVEHGAAIRRTEPGEAAATLARADIGKAAHAAPRAPEPPRAAAPLAARPAQASPPPAPPSAKAPPKKP